jgi:1,4-dihydroxy-2-naphthoate octaprenyltransferase
MFKIAWLLLLIVGIAIFGFGIVGLWYSVGVDPLFSRSIGVASIGMGLFGSLITLFAYRRRERWAWFALWYYPLFWAIHLIGKLPPGKDHVHQVVFIVLSLAGLLLPLREFFSPKAR